MNSQPQIVCQKAVRAIPKHHRPGARATAIIHTMDIHSGSKCLLHHDRSTPRKQATYDSTYVDPFAGNGSHVRGECPSEFARTLFSPAANQKGHEMKTNRRSFFKLAGAAGAGMIAVGKSSGSDEVAFLEGSRQEAKGTAVMTELFLDNKMIEVTPGVSRRLHKPKKHLLNPVVRCDRWCEGNNIQPYTTMYDKEDKLFKMWARTGSDWKSKFLDGHAAYMLYFTSTDGVHWIDASAFTTTDLSLGHVRFVPDDSGLPASLP
jgi:hypothetical protein